MQKENQKKTENIHKSNKRSNLDHLFPGSGARKRGLVDGVYAYQTSFGLHPDKSSVVVKGPCFFPQV
jgi:hypothetical protein